MMECEGVIMNYIKKSLPRLNFVNHITELMEFDKKEDALDIINKYFCTLSLLEKKLLTINIIEATTQYNIPSNSLPESYFDFLVSDDSNDVFFNSLESLVSGTSL